MKWIKKYWWIVLPGGLAILAAILAYRKIMKAGYAADAAAQQIANGTDSDNTP